MRIPTGRRAALALASAVLTSGVALGIAAAPAAQAATGPRWGCPGGAVCMYTEAGWAASSPQHVYYSYGYHALYEEHGWRVVFNNQYATSAGRAGAQLCTRASAAYCDEVILMDQAVGLDIEPVNYVRLTSSGG